MKRNREFSDALPRLTAAMAGWPSYLYALYFESAGRMFVKVGHSKQPGARMYQHLNGPRFPLYADIIACETNDIAKWAEQLMMQELAPFRAGGMREWFALPTSLDAGSKAYFGLSRFVLDRSILYLMNSRVREFHPDGMLSVVVCAALEKTIAQIQRAGYRYAFDTLAYYQNDPPRYASDPRVSTFPIRRRPDLLPGPNWTQQDEAFALANDNFKSWLDDLQKYPPKWLRPESIIHERA